MEHLRTWNFIWKINVKYILFVNYRDTLQYIDQLISESLR